LTDYWLAYCHPSASTPATNPANWSEVRLTDASFALEQAPTRFYGAFFLGDYEGLAAVGNDFVAAWGMPDGSATSQESIFFRREFSTGGHSAALLRGSAAPGGVGAAILQALRPAGDAVVAPLVPLPAGGVDAAGLGAGIYNDGGTSFGVSSLTVTGSTITVNQAQGGAGDKGSDGEGVGGGAYFRSGGSVCLDRFTRTNLFGNSASTSNDDIFGSWAPC
jgi:hypothetical protein